MLFLVKNLSISFNKNAVLKNVSFSIPSTGLHAIVGKSGCGKSTLLNALHGIVKATSGTIEFMSRNIGKFKDKEFANFHEYDVSMVFQHYNLLSSLSSLENVILPLLIRGEKRKDAIKKATDLFNKFSLEKIIDQNVDSLSGGEKQRVAILRALIINPKVLMCDEPTGALDKANSILVMEMFKEISKTTAVIMVSHNKELVKKYADHIISIQCGEIIDDYYVKKIIDSTKPVTINKTRINSHWTKILVKKYLHKNKIRNALAIIATSFGFVTTFVSFGFTNGSKKSEENALLNNYSATTSTISLKTYYEIDNSPLMFEKNVRPSVEDIDNALIDVDYLRYEVNLDYAFSPYPKGTFDGSAIESLQMVPVINNLSKLSEVFINQEMSNCLGNKQIKIGDIISISNNVSFSLSTGNPETPFIKDIFSYKLDLEVKDIVKEFSFLNTPKIYYSYELLANYLKSVLLDNISKYKQESISIYRYIRDSSNDDVASSYSLYAFVKDKSFCNQYFDLIASLKEGKKMIQVDSTAYEIKESYRSFMSSFSNALFVFIIISFACINLIVGMLSLSLFIENKKESAILTCLGARNRSIISIYLKQNILLIVLSFLISMLVIFPIQFLLNVIVKNRFGLSNLIDIPFYKFQNIYFGLPIFIVLISLIASVIFVLVPIFFYKKISLVDELKDE